MNDREFWFALGVKAVKFKDCSTYRAGMLRDTSFTLGDICHYTWPNKEQVQFSTPNLDLVSLYTIAVPFLTNKGFSVEAETWDSGPDRYFSVVNIWSRTSPPKRLAKSSEEGTTPEEAMTKALRKVTEEALKLLGGTTNEEIRV